MTTKPEDIEYDPERHGIVRAKGILDGTETLAEAAVRARDFAAELDAMVAAGWELMAPVDGDYGYVAREVERG